MFRSHRLLGLLIITLTGCCAYRTLQPTCSQEQRSMSTDSKSTEDMSKRPESYWKDKLDPEVYQVTRCSATEPPFSGKYWDNHRGGEYRCSNCGALLFDSKDKFDSGTGWPSFTRSHGDAVENRPDYSMAMERQE